MDAAELWTPRTRPQAPWKTPRTRFPQRPQPPDFSHSTETARSRPLLQNLTHTTTGLALLKQTGDEVTGSIGADERNQHPLDGGVKGNLVTLTTHPRPGRTVAFDKCYLTVDAEKMTGTTERKESSDKGTIELVRMKD